MVIGVAWLAKTGAHGRAVILPRFATFMRLLNDSYDLRRRRSLENMDKQPLEAGWGRLSDIKDAQRHAARVANLRDCLLACFRMPTSSVEH